MASDDHRSAAEIEREIEAERNALTRTLDEIQERLSFEALSGDLMGRVRENSGDIGRAVARSVKENPVPLALTAIGLTWLMISNRRSDSDAVYDDPYDGYLGTRPGGAAREAGLQGATPAYRRPIYDASGRPIPGDADEGTGTSRWDKARASVASAGHAAGDRWREGRDAASAGAASARDEAAARFGSARDHASEGLHSAGEAASSRYRAGRDAAQAGASRFRSGVGRAAEESRRRAHGAYASAAELRERITHGTHDLSEQARARIIAARTRAYEAQLRAEYYAARGRDKALDLFEDQPLVVGALAIAVGAAIGGLLPRTSREDNAFGAYRDELFEEAERVYREERAKLESVARETAGEAKRVARETAEDLKEDAKELASQTEANLKSKLSDAEAKTRDAAQQVGDKAKEEADKKNLGNR